MWLVHVHLELTFNLLQGFPNLSIAGSLSQSVSQSVCLSLDESGIGFEGPEQCMLIRLFAYLLLSLSNSHLMPGLDETPAEMPLTH